MRTLAQELARSWIRVNSVLPTAVRTPMAENEAMGAFAAANPETMQNIKNLLPIDWVEPIDISSAVLWLCSDQARYVTGVALPIDAGQTAR